MCIEWGHRAAAIRGGASLREKSEAEKKPGHGCFGSAAKAVRNTTCRNFEKEYMMATAKKKSAKKPAAKKTAKKSTAKKKTAKKK